jgi:transposase-like protein
LNPNNIGRCIIYPNCNEKDRAATEEKIYTAFGYIKRKRPQGVGINAIAKEAGVSKSLIYRWRHERFYCCFFLPKRRL